MQHFSNVALISTKNQEYIANNRGYKRKSDSIRKFKKVDPFASDYNQALRKWEWVVKSLLYQKKLICDPIWYSLLIAK
jgi:hypothetical protein